jgi:hypothetical protein
MAALRRRFGKHLKEMSSNYFDYAGPAIVAKALNYVEGVLQTDVTSPLSSGIVIAGFGDDELFPALSYFDTDGYIGNKLKIIKIESSQITRDTPSMVAPFAQKDMVQRFMEGIDPEYSSFTNASISSLLGASCLYVLEKYGADKFKNDRVRQSVVRATSKAFDDHLSKKNEFKYDKFTHPILQMVAMLPKDELPVLAESLISLTSLKRHVSSDAETVGGPTDVALISKVDGFIWIKRKHYFKAELNPHFVANYRRKLDHDDEGESNGTNGRRPAARAGKK